VVVVVVVMVGMVVVVMVVVVVVVVVVNINDKNNAADSNCCYDRVTHNIEAEGNKECVARENGGPCRDIDLESHAVIVVEKGGGNEGTPGDKG